MTTVGRSRVAFIDSPSPRSLEAFEDAVKEAPVALGKLRQLTADNPAQRAMCDRLQAITDQRVVISRQSVELIQQNRSTPEKQLQINSAVAKTAYDNAAITQQMRRNEDALLQQRNQLSKLLFDTTLGVLAISFLLAGLMFRVHYQPAESRTAGTPRRGESVAPVEPATHPRAGRGTQKVRPGIARRFGADPGRRENHGGYSSDRKWGRPASHGTRRACWTMRSRRPATISYLFHPPLLDESGFASAAKWLVDGYAQRMGMEVSANFPRPAERLPRSVEITLYRVLQEALNNIHRHSRSTRADVSLQTDDNWTTLRVKDYGRGIPNVTLEAFRTNGTQAGVGLTGMKERVKEQGGRLEIRSDGTGTEVIATIPTGVSMEASTVSPAEPILNMD